MALQLVLAFTLAAIATYLLITNNYATPAQTSPAAAGQPYRRAAVTTTTTTTTTRPSHDTTLEAQLTADIAKPAADLHGDAVDVFEPLRAPIERVCGSPAVDGYSHVSPDCLERSPTNVAWQRFVKGGGSNKQLVSHEEVSADYDGLAVAWGPNNKKASWQDCAQACKDHVPGAHVGGPFQHLPCNAWVWCPDAVCFEPDAHKHTKGDCWLKFTELPASPEVNMRGDMDIIQPEFRQRHRSAPARVQWIAGVLLPPGQLPSNGTWSPRFRW
ncbi:hypothetical protein RI054_08g45390 [Pseudoscourfieldia marina]